MSRWLAFVLLGVLALAFIEVVRVGPNTSSKIVGGAMMLFVVYRVARSVGRPRSRIAEGSHMFRPAEMTRRNDSVSELGAAPRVPMAARIRDALRASNRFATYFALVALSGAIGSVIVGRAPLYAVLVAPALGYAVYFLLPLVLQLTGAATTDLNVNLWFAWAVCGGLVFFWVGLLFRGHDVLATIPETLRAGLLGAGAWIICVLLVWFVRRVWQRRGA